MCSINAKIRQTIVTISTEYGGALFQRPHPQIWRQQSLTLPPVSAPLHNNNLCLIMAKTNRSTLHTVYHIQQSATQGSDDTTHRLSRRTAATTRFSPEGIGCQKQTAPWYCQHSIRWAFTSQVFNRWRHFSTHPINRPATRLSTPEGSKAELA